MTVQCDNALDALGVGVDRLKQLGIAPESIIRWNQKIVKGCIVIVRDHESRPWAAAVPPTTRFSTVLTAMGI